jgi:small nuclear ribonucleoprotein
MSEQSRPFDILNGALNKRVLIRLKGGSELRGIMTAYDVHMNLVLQDAEQLENGESKRKLGTMLVRGDSVIFLSPAEEI